MWWNIISQTDFIPFNLSFSSINVSYLFCVLYCNVNVMTNLVKLNIEAEGARQHITVATRFWPHHREYLIDQIWSNCPHTIISVKNIVDSTSDHNIVEFYVKLKGNIGAPKEIRKITMKNWDSERYRARIEAI